MRPRERIKGWLARVPPAPRDSRPSFARGPITHVVVLDGTMSSLRPGCETHAGTAYKLLCEVPARARLSLYYEEGSQWLDWRHTNDVAFGHGLNRQIERAYGHLASRYRPGDRIVLLGYSRGAYAARSLAGVIDRVGLLEARHALARNVAQAYRHYRAGGSSAAAHAFTARYCHAETPIEVIGVWDTVKSLGIRLPLLWMLTESRHAFHNHELSPVVRHGYHALSLDETREVFAPVLWTCRPGWPGHVEQVWFRGCHGDVGGHLIGDERARPLANIPLVWMLDKLERHDVPLPAGWRDRFPQDQTAPSVGTMRGWGKLFLWRRRRAVGQDASERLHPTAVHSPRQVELPLCDMDDVLAGDGTSAGQARSVPS